MTAQPRTNCEALDDAALARRFGEGDPAAVRLVTVRNNRRLFRAAWSILKDRHEAEDVVQTSYVRAFGAIHGFEGRSSLSTWLTRIAINEALERRRSAARREAALAEGSVIVMDDYREKLMRGSSPAAPDEALARDQLRRLLEKAIAQLPDDFRTVFVLREIEQLGVAEVAEALGLPPATVKTRSLRARRRLQEKLAPEIAAGLAEAFPFDGEDCAALTERVVALLAPE